MGLGMSVIINPRGTSGSGKTELVRRILAEYGWRRDRHDAWDLNEPIFRTGRAHPFAYRLQHPGDGRPLVVVGHYQVTSGGCDTIRAQDGGLPEVMRFAGDFASGGHDVIIEGLRLSSDVEMSARLAAAHCLHIFQLSTPLARCVENLVVRRRAGASSRPAIERITTEEQTPVEDACERLRHHAAVEVLDFDHALGRSRDLLGLGAVRAAA